MESTETPPTSHANKSARVAVVGCQITLQKLVIARILATEEKSLTTSDPVTVVLRVPNSNASPRRPDIITFVGAGYGVMPTWDLGLVPKRNVLAEINMLRNKHVPKSQAS